MVLNQDEFGPLSALLDELDVAEEFVVGKSLVGQNFIMLDEDILEGRHFFIYESAKHIFLSWSDLTSIVIVDLNHPELLESRLFLHLTLEDTKLRSDS